MKIIVLRFLHSTHHFGRFLPRGTASCALLLELNRGGFRQSHHVAPWLRLHTRGCLFVFVLPIRFVSQVAQRVASLGALSSGGSFHRCFFLEKICARIRMSFFRNMYGLHYHPDVHRPSCGEVYCWWFWHCKFKQLQPLVICQLVSVLIKGYLSPSHKAIDYTVQFHERDWRCCSGRTERRNLQQDEAT